MKHLRVMKYFVAALLAVGFIIAWSAASALARQDPLLVEALEAHNLGDVKKAVEIYTEYLQKDPNSAEAHNWRGMAYDDLGDSDRALADFNRAIELSPKYAEPFNNRGEIYRKKKDFGRALADYNKAIELEANFAEPRFNIALVQEAQGQPQQAARSFLGYLRINPDAQDRKQILLKIRQLAQAAPPAPAQVTPPPGPPAPPKPGAPQPTVAKPAAPPPGVQPTTGPPKKKFKPGAPVAPPEAKKPADEVGGLGAELPLVGTLLALAGVLGVLVVVPVLVIYLFLAFMLFLIARKTNTDMPWLAFIPIIQVLLMVRIAGKPIWWFAAIVVLFLLGIALTPVGLLPEDIAGMVSGVLSLIAAVLMLPIFLGIASARGKSAIWGILAWLPCTHPIGMIYLGLSR
ncbi:MAG: tetratricopeptide repeat protein [Desulfomonile sp.]|nr:tetratricopeptide repeat protein [Desulfomonile sp.]